MLLLTIKVKEAMFAVVLMTADAQLGKRDRVFSDNPYSLLVSPPPPQNKKEVIKDNLKNCSKGLANWAGVGLGQ